MSAEAVTAEEKTAARRGKPKAQASLRVVSGVQTDPSRDALLTDFGKKTLDDRYVLPGESYQQMFARVALAYSSYHMSGFEETGGGEAAMRLADLRLQRLESRAGARLSGEVRLGRWALRPAIQADLVHTLSGADDGMRVSFAQVPDFAFALPFADGDASWGEVRGGFTLDNGRFGFGAGVETAIGRSGYQDDRAVADFTYRF